MNRIILTLGLSSLCLSLLAADPVTPAATPAATPRPQVPPTAAGSGIASSLGHAHHTDRATKTESAPCAREAGRLWCAAVNAPQTTLDPQQMREWTPNSKYGGHAFGFLKFDDFFAGREK